MLLDRLIAIKEELLTTLVSFLKHDPLILGVGTPLRTDDSFGLVACDLLNSMGIGCVKCEYGIESCIAEINDKRPRALLIIDAVLARGSPPGSIIMADESAIASGEILVTTHNIPLKTLLEILRKEYGVEKIMIIGATPFSLDYGLDLTGDMMRSLEYFINVFKQAFFSAKKDMKEESA
jgi:hydrogenase 3 maturation protease